MVMISSHFPENGKNQCLPYMRRIILQVQRVQLLIRLVNPTSLFLLPLSLSQLRSGPQLMGTIKTSEGHRRVVLGLTHQEGEWSPEAAYYPLLH